MARALRRLAAVLLALMTSAGAAAAGDNDIVLSRLSAPSDFRSLVSELGTVLAPRISSPADTLGFGGFELSVDLGVTSINDAGGYWRARAGSPQPAGAGPHGGALMPTLGVFARKGLWLPLPSFELGAGLVHLLDSRMVAAQGYAKFALIEGYHDLPLPSLAVRGAVSRVMGQADVDLTVVSLDASIGKEFGVAGTFNLTPYAGYNALLIIPRSELIDGTPDQAGDFGMNFLFADQDAILRHRIFGGARFRYNVFIVALEGQFTLAGASVDEGGGTGAVDTASAQVTVVTSVGVEF